MITHGHTVENKKSKEYRAWEDMRQRCYNKNNASYKNYGGRGITVCDRWNESFENFLEDMGYGGDKWLDRVDNNEGYSPENCQWRTPSEQLNNTRRNVVIEYDRKRMTMAEWAIFRKINPITLQYRISHDWPVGEALEYTDSDRIENQLIEFNGEKLCFMDWCKKLGVKESTMRARFARGWSLDRALTPNVQKRKSSYELNGIKKPLNKWCEHYNMSYNRVKSRVSEGWTLKEALEIAPRVGTAQYNIKSARIE